MDVVRVPHEDDPPVFVVQPFVDKQTRDCQDCVAIRVAVGAVGWDVSDDLNHCHCPKREVCARAGLRDWCGLASPHRSSYRLCVAGQRHPIGIL